jgi:SAM-dependent methyltransferase
VVAEARRPRDFGELRTIEPITRSFGLERGTPIDRFYIERFLQEHAADIRGSVLEVGDPGYTERFGGDRVEHSEVLHATPGNPRATLVADLTDAPELPSGAFDCFVCTQTLTYVWPLRGAIRTVHRILKPGGVVLATLPGISQLSPRDNELYGEFWRVTALAARRLFAATFGEANVETAGHGNVLAAAAFLYGVAQEDLEPAELEHADPFTS